MMANTVLIKLKNITQLHMGTGKENYDFAATSLQSDTLSSALSSMKAQRGDDNDLKAFLESFVISSAFPYIGNRYFLPKPMGRIDITVSDEDEYVVKKKLKKLNFIERELWNELIAGKRLVVKRKQVQGSFLFADKGTEETSYPYRSQVNQRVTVSWDEGKDAEPFFFEWTYFHKNAGLYCLLDAPVNMQEELIGLFKQLGECGIGTDKSVGGGHFEVEAERVSLPDVKDTDAVMLLSLFIPTEDELHALHLKDSCYELLLRGGYISGSSNTEFMHLRKKSVYMFNAGSVFKTLHPLEGKVVDLRPEWNDATLHPVFRSGRPFTILIKRQTGL